MAGLRTTIDEIVGGIYRISSVTSTSQVTFNQFLVDDELPMLVHTGEHGHYEQIRAAIARVLDPARLAYVVLLHFEGDECGGMNRFMAEAPQAQLVASALSAGLNLARFPWRYRVLDVREGDTLDLGRHSLRVLETPHVHHWDSMMFFEETTRSLFPSDLFLQPGNQPPNLARSENGRPTSPRDALYDEGRFRATRAVLVVLGAGARVVAVVPACAQQRT